MTAGKRKENILVIQIFREAVCVHTDKIYDSCRDKELLGKCTRVLDFMRSGYCGQKQ